MEPLTNVLEFLNRSDVRFVLALAGGFAIKRWSQIETKAIPLVLQVLSLVVMFVGTAFGVKFEPTVFQWLDLDLSGIDTAGFFSGLKLSTILDGVLTVVLASGTQSQVKNVWQWIGMGASLIRK